MRKQAITEVSIAKHVKEFRVGATIFQVRQLGPKFHIFRFIEKTDSFDYMRTVTHAKTHIEAVTAHLEKVEMERR